MAHPIAGPQLLRLCSLAPCLLPGPGETVSISPALFLQAAAAGFALVVPTPFVPQLAELLSMGLSSFLDSDNFLLFLSAPLGSHGPIFLVRDAPGFRRLLSAFPHPAPQFFFFLGPISTRVAALVLPSSPNDVFKPSPALSSSAFPSPTERSSWAE
jgi:hypothetical protein